MTISTQSRHLIQPSLCRSLQCTMAFRLSDFRNLWGIWEIHNKSTACWQLFCFSKGKQWLCLLSKHHQIPDWLCQVLEAIPPELYVTNHKKWMSLRVGGGGGAGGVGLPFCCWCLGWSPEQRIKPASLHPSWCSLWTSVGTKSVSDILSWVLFTNCLKSDFVTCLWDGNVKL